MRLDKQKNNIENTFYLFAIIAHMKIKKFRVDDDDERDADNNQQRLSILPHIRKVSNPFFDYTCFLNVIKI
jgi:hypothetical protein